MRGRRILKCAATLLLLLVSPRAAWAQGGAAKPRLLPCRAQPSLVGRCFNVRGRLSLYNGAPTVRLWRAGTRRVLGVSGSYAREGYSSIPEELERMLDWETELWGEFLVCPFTPRRPGEMQMVCVESGRNVSARKRPANVRAQSLSRTGFPDVMGDGPAVAFIPKRVCGETGVFTRRR